MEHVNHVVVHVVFGGDVWHHAMRTIEGLDLLCQVKECQEGSCVMVILRHGFFFSVADPMLIHIRADLWAL